MTAKSKQRVCGPFVPDPDVPARYDDGGRVTSPGVCLHCHLPGQPGDAHHTLPSVPEQAEHRRRAGETS